MSSGRCWHVSEYPPEPKPKVVNDWLDRADLLEATGITKVDLSEIDPNRPRAPASWAEALTRNQPLLLARTRPD